MPVSETPKTLVDRAADEAMKAAERHLNEHGAEPRHMLVIIDAKGQPADEPNATAAGHGYDNDRDVLAELLTHAHELGKEMGVEVNVISPTVRGQG